MLLVSSIRRLYGLNPGVTLRIAPGISAALLCLDGENRFALFIALIGLLFPPASCQHLLKCELLMNRRGWAFGSRHHDNGIGRHTSTDTFTGGHPR